MKGQPRRPLQAPDDSRESAHKAYIYIYKDQPSWPISVSNCIYETYDLGGYQSMKHPDTVGKLAVLGSSTRSLKTAWEPATYQQFLSLPDDFAPPVLKDPYDR
jgi:hypothetical protein